MSADTSDFSIREHAALIAELAQTLGHAPTQTQLEQLARYVELVVTWNRKLDLTAARGARAQLEVLLADGIVLAREHITPHAARLFDVGSGAGAPVVPLLLLRPDLHATLIEPLHKRGAFLRTVLGTLSLTARARALDQKLDPNAPALTGGPYDFAMSRATFAPDVWVPAALQLAARAVALLATGDVPTAPPGAERLSIEHYALPWSKAPRQIAVYTRNDVPL
jgi:16S rRNA (guanine527-N7)-methyltransferase